MIKFDFETEVLAALQGDGGKGRIPLRPQCNVFQEFSVYFRIAGNILFVHGVFNHVCPVLLRDDQVDGVHKTVVEKLFRIRSPDAGKGIRTLLINVISVEDAENQKPCGKQHGKYSCGYDQNVGAVSRFQNSHPGKKTL